MLKRIFDILFSLFALILLSPLFLILSIIIKISSPGPVFYKGKRMAKGGGIFYMHKFRSMVVNADKFGTDLTKYEDKRITKIGKFLRRTKLDELPNLIDVLKGDMSIVGPRPESPLYAQHYNERQRRVLDVRPGITGLAQLENRREDLKLKDQADPDAYYINVLMPKKLEIDLFYVENRTFLMDIKIILKTLFCR
ncbi:TPA: sugar transferase [Candidatus Poribacteria bacterium]|nr:sugar transferase [Candidatus Poribacteria bacterium]